MKWNNRRRSLNVSDRRSIGGKTIAGGGLGFLGIGVVIALLGGDPSYFFQEGITRTVQSINIQENDMPKEEQDRLVDFVSVVLAETEDTWDTVFAQNNAQYPKPNLVFFSGSTQSACGYAQTAMGPFYCPPDQKIYIDLKFFQELEKRHDAPGDFAQAYVIAHEVGHHVQHLLGVLDEANTIKRRVRKAQANEVSVQVELMADCFAGLWAHDVKNKGLLEDGDIKEALNAASQIGDDVLQEQTQGRVVPDSFTHGTGEQRYNAFNKGFAKGDFATCSQ